MLYAALTGQEAFRADSVPETLRRIIAEQPTPLENIILQCLEKDPDDRPGSAEELARMLERTGLSAAWTQERARDWWDDEQGAGREFLRHATEIKNIWVPYGE